MRLSEKATLDASNEKLQLFKKKLYRAHVLAFGLKSI
jgi:hypothetical protein